MAIEYRLNFDGSLGDFIKQNRKANKINSVDLSKELGKSVAYISQIEHGHNKKPDFDNLYEIFKRIGIDENKIEDYLEHFGFMTPEREEAKIQEEIERQNISSEEYEQIQKQERDFLDNHEINISNDDDLLRDIFNSDINRINSTLSRIVYNNNKEGFKFIRNLESILSNMTNDNNLYQFLLLFSDNDLDVLDEKGMIKVINILHEEMNRSQKESPWGVSPTTKFKQPIDKL